MPVEAARVSVADPVTARPRGVRPACSQARQATSRAAVFPVPAGPTTRLNRSVPEISRYTFDWERCGRLAAKALEDCLHGDGRNDTVRSLLPKFIPGATLARRRVD